MTPIYKISFPSSNTQVYAKLENQNPTGTHKDRSIGPWIEHYRAQGISEFAIASSGNSAISAAKYCKENKLKLHIFVSPELGYDKELRLAEYAALPRYGRGKADITVSCTKIPRRDAIRFCTESSAVNLRASTDDNAFVGYKAIAIELVTQLPHIDNIFIPTSSGSTLTGIYHGFRETLSPPKAVEGFPSFFAVQTAKVHPIASYFDKNFKKENRSDATSIVDNIAHRRDTIIEICKETGGGGFVISDRELKQAMAELGIGICGVSDTPHIPNSPDNPRHDVGYRIPHIYRIKKSGWQSALAFAGFLKWSLKNVEKSKRLVSVCLFTD